ncbi:MAG: hypothetical protein RLZZ543_129 [Bacteroidota bacterium]|jgi:hypothetical protein
MKKSFTLLLAFAMGLGMVAKAQTFINENFTSTTGTALPAGWSQVTTATDGGFKTGTAAGLSSTYWTVPTASGRIIATNDDACNCNKSNEILSLSSVDLSAASAVYMKMDVFFYAATIAPATEEADLVASTDNGTTWTSVYTFTGAAGWQNITVDVSQYAGNAAVTFGYRYKDNGGWMYGLAVDNISLFVPAQFDVALSSNDMADYVVMGAVPVTGTVYNAGTATISSLDVSYSVDGGAPVSTTLNGLNIAPLTSYSFTHPTNWTANTPGSYSVAITIDMPNGNPDVDGTDNSATKTVNVATQAVANLPLVEEFSSNTCAPCASFNATFIPLLEANNANTPTGTVSVVKYQMNWPSPGTDRSYNEDGNTRRGFYGVTGIPDAYLGGFSMGGSQAEIDAAAAEVAVMDIDVNAVYAGNTVTADVTVSPYANFTAGMKLYIALVEDSYADAGTNGETAFHYIMRKMLSPATGISLPAMTAGTPVSQTAAYAVTFGNVTQLSFNLWGSDFEGMTVVAWVQNATTSKVFQSAIDESLSVGIQTPDAIDFKVYPNPASNNMNIRVDMKASSELKMNVYNSLGQLVDTKAYNFNGAGVQNISYSTESLSDGMYMVQLVNGTSVSSRGIVVKH